MNGKTSVSILFCYLCHAYFRRKPKGGVGIYALYIEKTFTGVWLSRFKTSQLLTIRKSRLQQRRPPDVYSMHALLSVGGHAVYISAWAFCVARSRLVGMRRPWNAGRAKVRFLRLFCIYEVAFMGR